MTDPTPRARTRATQHQQAAACPGSSPGTRSAVRAAVVTVDPLLAAHLAALHTGVHTAVLTRLPGTTEGTLRDTDALLVLAGRPTPDGPATRPTTIYVGTDLDDASGWARAVKLRADHVVVLPDTDAEAQLRQWLREHLDAAA